ncbi:TIGR03943 family protein [Verrucomicrobiaceae bacterium 227]
MTSLQTRLFGLIACSWGGVLVYFYHSTRVRKYLAPDFHHFILAGGIGILVLGIYSVINPSEKKVSHDHDHDHQDCGHDHDHADCGHEHEDCESCDHHHDEGHGPIITALLTLVPLILAMTYTTDDFSFTALAKKKASIQAVVQNENRPPFTREDLEKNVSRNKHGEFEIRMITAFYAAGDREIQDIFDGLPVELEGRIAPETLNNDKGDRMRIFRSMITCCAADMQMVDVALEFPEGTARPSAKDWVKAGGTLTFETINGDVYPLLKVREVVQAEEPYSEFQLRQ